MKRFPQEKQAYKQKPLFLLRSCRLDAEEEGEGLEVGDEVAGGQLVDV